MAQPNPNRNNTGKPQAGALHKPTPRTQPTPARPLPPPTKTTAAPAAARAAAPATPKVSKGPVRPFLFDRSNYQMMLLGVGLILLGLFLMAGGKSADPHQFHYNEIFSFRRVTLAPLVMMLGFGLQFYAILKRPRTATRAATVIAEEAPIAVTMEDRTETV